MCIFIRKSLNIWFRIAVTKYFRTHLHELFNKIPFFDSNMALIVEFNVIVEKLPSWSIRLIKFQRILSIIREMQF